MYSRNNAKYALPYFINSVNHLERFIDSLDIQVIGDRCELLVYLKTINRYTKWRFTQEPQFSRLIIKNGKLCAIFSSKQKDNASVYLIYKCGISGCSKYSLECLYKQKGPSCINN